MILRSPTENENANFVMPAWTAGIQIRKDASGNIHVNLIPALHAGMTQSRRLSLNDRSSYASVFSKEQHEQHEGKNLF